MVEQSDIPHISVVIPVFGDELDLDAHQFPSVQIIEAPYYTYQAVEVRDLTSVHFKQKNSQGILTQVKDGFVDFRAIIHRLAQEGYTGDLLLENAPSDQPLEDAIKSRDYLQRYVA